MFDKHALSLWLKKIGISYKVKNGVNDTVFTIDTVQNRPISKPSGAYFLHSPGNQ